ncbi:C2H2-type domain-containing protein [Fusarium keratoplasticum]|uniref:C2H2-type domain-containing protein n=1 Tax=Fusarium keratoplasticum TaxID=1328300 RepID=A0ACC0QUS1_9HYPO|nr:C2H2-type domain-containing protein [Fusarium keratoplasticum]KAI8666317.1 C2H2-type domain-containing protein [Fusarium keratoplasticum]
MPLTTTSTLSCSTCQVSFETVQEQRQHAKSELHIENLRRKVADLGINTLPSSDTYQAPSSNHRSQSPNDKSSESDSGSDREVNQDEMPEFVPENCIFCSHQASDIDDNLAHMKTTHSLTIPFQDNLVVEPATLIWYLHFVIFGYHECILCGTRRRTVEGVQQHMLDKGHCRFEMSDEMMEFYDVEGLNSHSTQDLVRPDEDSIRLPSGKILSHRSQTASSSRPRITNQSTSTDQEPAAIPGAPPTDALTNRGRKETAMATQLSRLSVKDQQSLIHLSAPQQRSLLAQRKKELETARRSERRMRIRMDRHSNKATVEHGRPWQSYLSI